MTRLYKGLSKHGGKLLLLLLLLCVQTLGLLLLPNMMSIIVNNGVLAGDIPFILQQGIIMLLLTLAGSAAAIGVGYLAAKIGVKFCTDIRRQLFRHIANFTLAEFDTVSAGSLTTRTTNDILQLQNFTIMMFRVIVLAPVMCVGGVVLSVQKNPPLSLILVICIPVIVLVLITILRKVMPVFTSMQSKLDKVNMVLRENITGVRVIRAFTAESREEDRFEEANADMTAASIRSQTLVATLMPIMMFVMNVCTVIVVWFGGNQIAKGQLQVGDLMAFIQYMMLILYALIMMSLILAILPRANVCANRICEVMDIEPAIANVASPVIPSEKTGVVEFRNVALTYGNAERPAISGINFTALPGQTTALIGATGSGKSSVICMIPRLRDASQGQVLVDGVDIKDYDIDALRERVSFVPQKSNLFSGTIRSNISFGHKDMSMERIQEAAKIAQADDFILQKAKGYDDPIAQGGSNVSGGQRQRLAIARALAGPGSILVFDDSFSALDFKTDSCVRQAIHDKRADATIIIVAQRVGTIMNADQILVLDEGQVIAKGTHDELVKNCDVYAEIVKTQLAKGGNEDEK